MAVFLDSEYLGKLMEGSFEATVVGVSDAVAAKPDLFGEGAETIATFGAHAIVMNPATGKTWRVRYESVPMGVVSILGAEPVDVPSRDDRDLSRSAKDAADAVVDAMLSGKDQETVELAGGLLRLAQEGVSLTMQAVEGQVRAFAGSDFPWREELAASKDEILEYVGDPEDGDVPYPKFAEIVGSGIEADGRLDMVVSEAMAGLVEFYVGMMERLGAVADADLSGAEVGDTEVPELDDFVVGVAEDVEEMAGYAEDALSAADTDPEAAARVYDTLASFAEDVLLAVAFVEKVVESNRKGE